MASAAVVPNASVLLSRTPSPRRDSLPRRRRPSPPQGRALELLGHAIEYLIDSRLPEGGTSPAENQAMRLMMTASRAVFEECPAVVPLTQKVGRWFQSRTGRMQDQAASL